jgi:phage baseplate assembly protein W
MSDLRHAWGGDVFAGPTGDLAIVSGPQLGTERVLRRLLTNPGDYLWQPGYGAGLARFVGQPTDPAAIRALVRQHMAREAAVAAEPEPVIEVQSDPGGTLSVQVRYADAETAEARTLTLQIPG